MAKFTICLHHPGTFVTEVRYVVLISSFIFHSLRWLDEQRKVCTIALGYGQIPLWSFPGVQPLHISRVRCLLIILRLQVLTNTRCADSQGWGSLTHQASGTCRYDGHAHYTM